MRPFRIPAFILSPSLVFAACAAQAQTAPSAPQPTIRAGANLVLIDVVVTDRNQPVYSLDRSAFHVFEDGKEQSPSSFDEHRPAAASPAVTRPALPANTYSNQPVWPSSNSVNVLLLDALNTPLTDQMNVRQKMIKYLATIKPGTPMAIFTLSSQLRMVTEFTTDPAALVAALKNSKGNPHQSAILASEQSSEDEAASDLANAQQSAQLTAGINTPLPNPASDIGAPMGYVQALQQFQADQIAFQNDVRMKITLDAMQELAGYLRGIPGRKNVIWFSGAFPLVTFPDSSLFRPFGNVSTYSEEIQKTATVLTRARIAIYPVDSGGLAVMPEFSVAHRDPVADKALGTQFMQETEQRYSDQATMQEVAGETGGRAFIETNDFDKAVEAAVDNGSNYYTIAYVPPADHLDGKFHKIEVRLDGDRKFKLAYRRGYYADAPGKPSSPSSAQSGVLATALSANAPVSTGIFLTARVLPAADPIFKSVSLPVPPAQNSASIKGPAHRYIFDLVVDTHGLALASTPEGDLKTAIEIAIAAYGANGQQLNNYVHGYQIGIKAAQSARVMATGLPLRVPFDLPSGDLDLRIGVRDLNADRTGSLHIPLHVAQQ